MEHAAIPDEESDEFMLHYYKVRGGPALSAGRGALASNHRTFADISNLRVPRRSTRAARGTRTHGWSVASGGRRGAAIGRGCRCPWLLPVAELLSPAAPPLPQPPQRACDEA